MEQIESRLNDISIVNKDGQSTETKWGWSLTDLYRSALSFYKGMVFFLLLWQLKSFLHSLSGFQFFLIVDSKIFFFCRKSWESGSIHI